MKQRKAVWILQRVAAVCGHFVPIVDVGAAASAPTLPAVVLAVLLVALAAAANATVGIATTCTPDCCPPQE